MAKNNVSDSILVIDSTSGNLGYILDDSKKLKLVNFNELDDGIKKTKFSRVVSYVPISGKNIDNEAYKTIYYPMQVLKAQENPEEFIVSKLYNDYAEKMEDNQDGNYMVKFVPTQSASLEHIDYDVLVYFDDDIRRKFGGYLSDVKYIDEIYPEPFLYKALYSKNILKPVGVDCFIYIDKERTTVTLYRYGEYFTYYENTQLKLNNFNRQLSLEIRENISEEAFASMIMQDGLEYSYYDPNTMSDKKFIDLFANYFIGHVSLFAMLDKLCKRKNIPSINNIIINSCYGAIKGFSDRLQQNYKDTKVINFKDLDLNLTINNLNDFYSEKDKQSLEEYRKNKLSMQTSDIMDDSSNEMPIFDLNINMFSLLSLLWIQSGEDMDDYFDVNITLFSRPPKFLKRRSGQILTLGLSVVFLAFLFPIGTMIFDAYINSKIDDNNTEISMRDSIIKRSKAEIAGENRRLDDIRRQREESEGALRYEQNLIDQINDKKNNYLIKSKCLLDISDMLQDDNINITRLEYKENGLIREVYLSIYAFDDNITAFIEKLIELGYDVSGNGGNGNIIRKISDKPKKHETDIVIRIKDGLCK